MENASKTTLFGNRIGHSGRQTPEIGCPDGPPFHFHLPSTIAVVPSGFQLNTTKCHRLSCLNWPNSTVWYLSQCPVSSFVSTVRKPPSQ